VKRLFLPAGVELEVPHGGGDGRLVQRRAQRSDWLREKRHVAYADFGTVRRGDERVRNRPSVRTSSSARTTLDCRSRRVTRLTLVSAER
jgi:hypothetical protein